MGSFSRCFRTASSSSQHFRSRSMKLARSMIIRSFQPFRSSISKRQFLDADIKHIIFRDRGAYPFRRVMEVKKFQIGQPRPFPIGPGSRVFEDADRRLELDAGVTQLREPLPLEARILDRYWGPTLGQHPLLVKIDRLLGGILQ